ncbi:M14 family zinc carboxypeptidase [Alkaliphilus peptidifermentans]|uniref:Copper amine oxidase N-terminal domain-containing protein n=1 Tax=Alkaliphilus peptidifermentans DSM 18978 TaxID=1120976 RepID=A0A1G5FGG9_9FIRM|nr:M14 family zinc carboxypeptidase [Alkaliphilus peptidifermentans]SCY38221.1 Copper amine oxidase N-terminal domain-containing protein [Alkaliphilus peptidifermentans DSM 18978]
MKKLIMTCIVVLLFMVINEVTVASNNNGIVDPYQPITYEIMTSNIKELEKEFPELIETEVIGQSADDRDIILVKLGKGDTLVHINGSFHARERITTNIILKNIEDYANGYVNNSKILGYDVKELLDEVTIFFVPMVNPDGVDYTILGKESIKSPLLREEFDKIVEHPQSTWFTPGLRWKSNIRGIDLNRQWDFGWDEESRFDIDVPADAHFKGFEPHSEAEVKAMEKLSISNPFLIYAAYHTQGLEIYWYKYQQGEDLEEVKDITRKISNLTFFRPVPALNNIPQNFRSFSGYADWTAVELKKPSFTMEFAYRQYSEADFDKIYEPAKALGLLFAEEALNIKGNYNVEVIMEGELIQLFKSYEDGLEFVEKYTTEDMDIQMIKNQEIIYQRIGKPYFDDIKLMINEKGTGDIMTEYNEEALRYKGKTFLPLERLFDNFDMELHYYKELKLMVAQNKDNIVVMSLNNGSIYLNHDKISLDNGIMRYDEKLYISTEAVEFIFDVELNSLED